MNPSEGYDERRGVWQTRGISTRNEPTSKRRLTVLVCKKTVTLFTSLESYSSRIPSLRANKDVNRLADSQTQLRSHHEKRICVDYDDGKYEMETRHSLGCGLMSKTCDEKLESVPIRKSESCLQRIAPSSLGEMHERCIVMGKYRDAASQYAREDEMIAKLFSVYPRENPFELITLHVEEKPPGISTPLPNFLIREIFRCLSIHRISSFNLCGSWFG